MASLTKKKDCKNWIACFSLPDGTRTNRSTGTADKKEAMQIALEMEKASTLARKGHLDEARARKVVNDILECSGATPLETVKTSEFLEKCVNSKENDSTQKRYQLIVTKFLKSLGRKANSFVSDVNYKDILKFIKLRQGEGVASKTVRVDTKILSTVFNLARKLGHTQHNPVERALAFKPLRSKSSTKETFSPAQVSNLIRHASGEWKTVIMLGYFTGARLQDCAKMTWENINFTKKTVDFVAKKSNVRAVVPMTQLLEDHLDAIASTDDPNPFLCPTLAQKSTGGKTGLSRAFKQIMAEAGIDPQEVAGQGKHNVCKLSFHSLRHSFNSLLANQGVDKETRMALVGQKSESVNNDYTHLDLNKLKSAMQKLPALNLEQS